MSDNNFEQNQQQFPQEPQQPQAQAPYTPPVQNQPVQQPYPNGQPQQGYYPQQQYAPAQPVEEKASIGLAILSFFIPLVGIILFFAKKKTKPKTAKACGIAALISIVLGVVIMLASGGDDETSTNTNNEITTSSSAVIPGDDETTTAPTTVATEEKTVYEVGDVFETKSLRITYVSCNANWTGYSSYFGPDSGNKVVRAEFTFENIGSSDEILDSLDCYADDVSCESFYGADDYKSPALESISQGRKFNAVVYYEVPEDADEIVLEYETSYWTSDFIKFVID